MSKLVSSLIFLLIAFIFISCNGSRKYRYIETVAEEGLLGGTDEIKEDPKEIVAINDSIAYCEAYQKFCISQKVAEEMSVSLGRNYHRRPVSFKLLNDRGEDITNTVVFTNQVAVEEKIKEEIFSMESSIAKTSNNSTANERQNTDLTTNVDSAKIKELIKYFKIEKDEFSNDNKQWYKPRSAPKYINTNAIYCYFQTENGVPSNFRFRVQYYADDWLFFKHIQFAIDGKAYEFYPGNVETDSGNGGYIWEWFDEQVSDSDKDVVKALSEAKSAKMKFIGSQYHNIKNITHDQILNIKRTIELYHALGGKF